jgi:hypothetical protein
MATRSKKTLNAKLSAMLPPKKSVKAKKKPAVAEDDVEETQAVSQADLARKKLTALMAAGEVSETKRLKDLAILEAAARDLEDCVLKETESKEAERSKLKGTKAKDLDGRKKHVHSRSRSRSSERHRSRSPKRRSRSPKRKSRSPKRRSRSPSRHRSKTPEARGRDRGSDRKLGKDRSDRLGHEHGDRRSEAPRRTGELSKRRSRSRSPNRRSRSRSPRRSKDSLGTTLPNGRSSSRRGHDGYEGKEKGASKDRDHRSRSPRKESSSSDESGDDTKVSKGGDERSGKGLPILFTRAGSIPDEVAAMAKMVKSMDQVCTGVAVRSAMLLDTVVNLLPSGSTEHEKRSLFASYAKNSVGNGGVQTKATSFGLDKLGNAILSGLCLRIVRRILLCSTADIPIMAFSAANAVILGSHDPSLPKLASKDSKMVDCSPRTTFDELVLFLVRWARVVYLVDPVYGSAISGLTCVVVDLHISNEPVMVIHEYIQLMKKLVVAGDGGDTFFPLFFVLQMQTLEQARLAVAEKARAKANENKPDGERPWVKKLKVIPTKIPKNTWAAPAVRPDRRDKAAIMEAGVSMSEDQIKLSSCHGWNNGTACSKLSPEGKCFFSHVCNVCLSSSHGRSSCPKKSAKKLE